MPDVTSMHQGRIGNNKSEVKFERRVPAGGKVIAIISDERCSVTSVAATELAKSLALLMYDMFVETSAKDHHEP